MEEELLRDFYDRHLVPVLQSLAPVRKRLHKIIRVLWFLFWADLLFLLLFIMLVQQGASVVESVDPLYSILTFIGLLIITCGAIGMVKKKYRNLFRRKAIPLFLRFLNSKVRLSQVRTFRKELIKKSGLFVFRRINILGKRMSGGDYRYRISDRVEGRVGGVPVRWARVEIYEEKEGSMDQLVEGGMLFVASWRNRFSKPVYVYSGRTPEGTFAASWRAEVEDVARQLKVKELPGVSGLQPEKLTAFGTDRAYARQLLEPYIAARLVEFMGVAGYKVYFSVVGNQAFLFVPTGIEDFLPQLEDEVPGFYFFVEYARILLLFFDIVLHLSQRKG